MDFSALTFEPQRAAGFQRCRVIRSLLRVSYVQLSPSERFYSSHTGVPRNLQLSGKSLQAFVSSFHEITRKLIGMKSYHKKVASFVFTRSVLLPVEDN